MLGVNNEMAVTPSSANKAKVNASTPKTSAFSKTPEPEIDETQFPPPIEYDEEVPVYWDRDGQCYYYYGYPIYWDEESENYYYYSYETGDYAYIDEETAELINTNQIYTYNNETGEYELEGDYGEDETQEWIDNAVESAEYEDDQYLEDAEEGAGENPVEGEVVQTDITPEEDDNGVLAQVDEDEEESADSVPAIVTPPNTPVTAAPMSLPTSGLYAMNVPDNAGPAEMSPSMQAMLKHVQAMNAASATTEKFPNSIDSFHTSYQNVSNKGNQILFEICSEDLSVLDQYRQRPNGTYVIGRCRRSVDALIKGSLELKSLAPTEISSVASILQSLSLPQLVFIRQNAQNSSWLKSPQAALKGFAMKCEECLGEKLIHFMVARSAFQQSNSDAVDQRNQKLLKAMGPMETRHCGTWAIYCIGALSELTTAKEKILGSDGFKSSWWWLSTAQSGGSTVLKGECDESDIKGIFMRIVKDERTGKFDLKAQFDW